LREIPPQLTSQLPVRLFSMEAGRSVDPGARGRDWPFLPTRDWEHIMSVATWSPGTALSALTFHQRREQLRRRMLDRVTPEDVAAIMQVLIQKALEGNMQALKLFLAYVIGGPDILEKLCQLEQKQLPPARPSAATAPPAPQSRKASPATPTPNPAAANSVAPNTPTAPTPVAAAPPSAKLDPPAAKTQTLSQLETPLLSPQEFERLVQQPIKPAGVGDAGGISVLTGPDRKNKRS
jgi:hypothetical protein